VGWASLPDPEDLPAPTARRGTGGRGAASTRGARTGAWRRQQYDDPPEDEGGGSTGGGDAVQQQQQQRTEWVVLGTAIERPKADPLGLDDDGTKRKAPWQQEVPRQPCRRADVEARVPHRAASVPPGARRARAAAVPRSIHGRVLCRLLQHGGLQGRVDARHVRVVAQPAEQRGGTHRRRLYGRRGSPGALPLFLSLSLSTWPAGEAQAVH
jgi:hypothetical protein